MNGLDLYKAEQALKRAQAARAEHSQVCTAWDYEDNGGCMLCDDHDHAVRTARHRLERTREALGI